MKIQEAKTYLQAAINGLSQLDIRATKQNVGCLAGVYQVLQEVYDSVEKLEPDAAA